MQLGTPRSTAYLFFSPLILVLFAVAETRLLPFIDGIWGLIVEPFARVVSGLGPLLHWLTGS